MTEPSSAASQTRRRVLVVDDDAGIREVMRRLLHASGYDTRIAQNGKEARALLKEEQFDVVLSDISMPELDGLELLQAVREHDLDVPVILVTGSPSVETAMRAIQYGALRYLQKPVDPQLLLQTLAYAAHVHELARLKRDALATLGKQQQAATDLAGLEASFNRALGSLAMHFQPIVTLAGRGVFAYEALARPNEPALPNPLALLDAAERLGRLTDVGRTIRERVATAAAQLPEGALLFVNLHPRDLVDDALYSPMAPLSKVAKRVVLEVTERATLHDVASLPDRFAALRTLGFRFALDDLGAGYAGLTSFVQITPEVVKLDMELVRDVDTNPNKQRVIRSITDLCREMKIMVVAEGVETRAERSALAGLGIDLLQGYAFAKPQPGFTVVQTTAFD